MLGREYWDAINGAEMVEVEGETAEEAFEEYVDSLAVSYAGNPIELELERIHLQKRRFVVIDDSPAEREPRGHQHACAGTHQSA